jgi:hypothetical protein
MEETTRHERSAFDGSGMRRLRSGSEERSMRSKLYCIAALAAALLAFPLTAAAAPTPAPVPSPKLPSKPLHAELQVEVNKLGQVVRVLHGNLSGDAPFDTMAMGNALQMWIREQHGNTITAVVGLYKVNYNYDPKTQKVKRTFALFKRGGNWANEPGAATKIVSDAKKEAQATAAALAKLKADQQKKNAENPNLPDINAALKKSRATPSPSPHP